MPYVVFFQPDDSETTPKNSEPHFKPAASKMFETFFFFFQLSEVVVVVVWGGGQKNADATAERNEPTALRLPLSLRRPPARPFPRVHGGIISH